MIKRLSLSTTLQARLQKGDGWWWSEQRLTPASPAQPQKLLCCI
ncbi:MAG TPA: hypothetical protein VJ124_21155 [Pyrinomonadaceae bacterium]|nr:hypothetical protein [Pyrinomonadaceae bacterium]